ncbi:hypothetical protein Tco_0696075 [Tanacetum coccineum]
MHTLELKSHTYYEHGTFKSFTCWKLTTKEEVEESAGSSNIDAHVDVKIKKLKRLAMHLSVATPSKPIKDRKKKRVDPEDSDDEVICAPSDGPEDAKNNSPSDNKIKRDTLWMTLPRTSLPKFQ